MRIGFSGAQSVGKTTLLNALRSEPIFKHYTICNEVTRRVKSYGLPINEDGNNITQKLIMQEHIVNVFMHKHMITDRTVLDGLVYSQYLHQRGNINDQTFLFCKDVFNQVINQYDLLFYIHPEFEVVDDGIRSVDEEFRNNIVQLFKQNIEENLVPVIMVHGSVRERVEQVLRFVKEKHEFSR